MVNYEKFITASPAELAVILCYYSSKGGMCTICGEDCIYNEAVCIKALYSWLLGAEDEALWKGLEEWRRQHNL